MQERQFRVADPCAPRFRPKSFDILNGCNKQFYASLKEHYPELGIYKNEEISRFIIFFNNVIAQEVVNNRNGVRLPDGLGIIVAGACRISEKTAANNRNHKVSEKLGVPILHNNLHSDTYVAKVKYSNQLDRHMFNNNDLWMFDASRSLARAVAAQFKNDNYKNYIVFTSYLHVTTLFRKQKIDKESPCIANAKKHRLDNYDEFAFNN